MLVPSCCDRSGTKIDQSPGHNLHVHVLEVEATIASLIHFHLLEKTTSIKIMYYLFVLSFVLFVLSFARAAITQYQSGVLYHRNVFLTVLEARNPRSMGWQC